MKGIFVVIGGLGDSSNAQLNEMTPLEAAFTPNLDFLATRGELGHMFATSPGETPSTENSLLSIFQNKPKCVSRSYLEAVGAGLKLQQGDLVFRVNFGTIGSFEKGEVIDRRVGRTLTTREARVLSKVINKINFPVPFEFVPTDNYKGILVFRGNYSDINISGNDFTYVYSSGLESAKLEVCSPLNRSRVSSEAAEMVNEFIHEVRVVLSNHFVNQRREKKGLLPANYLFLRSPSVTRIPLKEYPRWVSANYTVLERGFSKTSGMSNFNFKYPKFKGVDSYGNLWDGLKKAVRHAERILNKNLDKFDYFYVHFKETDIPGHDNKPFEKKAMIEYLDKTFFRYLVRIAPMKKLRVVVTGDHSTCCKMKSHSSDPVPVLLYNGLLLDGKKVFNEKTAKSGSLRRIIGCDLFEKTGFVRTRSSD